MIHACLFKLVLAESELHAKILQVMDHDRSNLTRILWKILAKLVRSLQDIAKTFL